MKDYERDICKSIQHDIYEIGGDLWELETVFNFWLEWSNLLCAGFLGYEKGDIQQLKYAIDILYDKEFK